MAKALRALPEYREIMSKLSQHMQIAHQCMDQFNKQGLLDLSDLEQTLATGKTDEGRTPKLKELLGRMVEQFRSRQTVSPMRLRLLAIVIVSQHGLSSGDLQKLLQEANLSRDELRTFNNLERMGCPIVREDDSGKGGVGKLAAKVRDPRVGARRGVTSAWTTFRASCRCQTPSGCSLRRP
jgi:syntaxin-binding protein 1